MTVDYRFRNDAEITDISAAVFFTETLPGLWQTSAGLERISKVREAAYRTVSQ
jgi:hypothetical protein